MQFLQHPLLNYRNINILLFIGPAALLGFGYYLQFVQDLEPCPLCMTQRLAFYGIAIMGFMALLNFSINGVFKSICAFLGAIISLFGAGIAARQIWLQHLPEDQVPACGPSLEYMLDTFPILEAVEVMLKGTGDCAKEVWSFLGLNIPEWAILVFMGCFVLNVFQLLRPKSIL